MTRKEKKLYEQMRQYQPPEVETEKYCEMQKKAQAEIAKGKILPRLHLFERICICQSGFGLRKESFLWQESY